MKKWLKIWLIVWWSLLVVWWAWAWLTKTWVIPNWFDVEVLCPKNSDNVTNFVIEDDCYKIRQEIKGYNKNNYDTRCESKYWENCKSNSNDLLLQVIEPIEPNSLKNLKYYNERISSEFEWYEEQIKEFENCKPNIDWYIGAIGAKPIIYLYPTTETQLNVKLWTPENLLHTYPRYNSKKWRNVIAQPNGDLEDIDTWRKIYALYWEWKSDTETNFNEWFIVAWKDIIPFLEEKLSILWLNEREAEEFIIYWLPQMEGNKYNLIRFETIEEQNENMPLNITPTPDTVIRVMMDWKVIDEPIEIPQQHLTTPERNGFTVVEWWWSPRK